MRRTSLIAAALLLACAGVPDPPAPGTSQAWGELRLVPREGVTPGGHGGGSYGDRRLRDVEFVDYSSPGFAVVYVADERPPAGRLGVSIRSSRLGPRFEPTHAAVGASGQIVVSNQTDDTHLVSYPAAGVVRTLAAGEQLELVLPRAGEQDLFLLDSPQTRVTVFASPGPFAVVSSTGRFRLPDLAPGSHEVRAWHPRFPPAAHSLVLAPDESVRVDFEIGVGRGEDGGPGAGHDHVH